MLSKKHPGYGFSGLPSKAFVVFICALFILVVAAASPVAAKRYRQKHLRLCTYTYEPQNGLGGISGRIMGALVPVNGATVTLMQNNKVVYQVTTGDDGRFLFRYFTPGQYDMIAEKADSRTSIISDIPVKADHLTQNDFYLPRFNNSHMPKGDLSEPYSYNRKFMQEN